MAQASGEGERSGYEVREIDGKADIKPQSITFATGDLQRCVRLFLFFFFISLAKGP